MKRIHLFEFEDQKWFPTFLRNYVTDFLQFLSNATGMYQFIVPLVVLWDGIVSSLRTYSVAELNQLVKSLDNHDTFTWEIGKIKAGPAKILYLIGNQKT